MAFNILFHLDRPKIQWTETGEKMTHSRDVWGYLSSSKVWDEGKGKTKGGKNSLEAAVKLWVGRNENCV